MKKRRESKGRLTPSLLFIHLLGHMSSRPKFLKEEYAGFEGPYRSREPFLKSRTQNSKYSIRYRVCKGVLNGKGPKA